MRSVSSWMGPIAPQQVMAAAAPCLAPRYAGSTGPKVLPRKRRIGSPMLRWKCVVMPNGRPYTCNNEQQPHFDSLSGHCPRFGKL